MNCKICGKKMKEIRTGADTKTEHCPECDALGKSGVYKRGQIIVGTGGPRTVS